MTGRERLKEARAGARGGERRPYRKIERLYAVSDKAALCDALLWLSGLRPIYGSWPRAEERAMRIMVASKDPLAERAVYWAWLAAGSDSPAEILAAKKLELKRRREEPGAA